MNKLYQKMIFVFSLLYLTIVAHAQTLGTYANTSIVAGRNTTITPSAAPTGTSSILAYANPSFTGVLLVSPTTGVVTVTNAKQAGVYTVTVSAFGAGTATTTFTLTVTNPACSQSLFTSVTNVPTGNFPYSVAIGDLNADGNQDMVVASANSNYISIRRGDGNGGFFTPVYVNVGVGSFPVSVALGDFNGDGRQDIAVANAGSALLPNTISILRGDGSGSINLSSPISVGTIPVSVAIGDFNGDGKQDFAAANFGSNNVSIRLGNGLGGNTGFPVTSNVAVGGSPRDVVVGDFNNDGKHDFAVVNSASSTISIRLGDGLGAFTAATDVSVSGAFGLALGDFNNDGNQDLAVFKNTSPATVYLRFGNGSGGFTGTNSFSVGGSPNSLAVGDFNGDGNQDVILNNNSGNANTVLLYNGNGAGSISLGSTVTVGSGGAGAYGVAVGDFNNDGRQDFATTLSNINAVAVRLGGIAEINVRGNSTTIPDGNTSISPTDFTEFNAGISTRTFTIQNTGTTALSVSGVTVTGPNASDFLVTTAPASSVAAAGSTTFVVTCTPAALGTRNATISIGNNDCDEAVYDFAVQGTGVIPTAGTYGNATVVAGQSTTVTPVVAPTNASSIMAYTSSSFTGVLSVNPSTGVVRVAGAKQAGTYTITVKASGLGTSANTTFTLTVTNPVCSQGVFTNPGSSFSPGIYPYGIANGDFNGDGIQDLAVTTIQSPSSSVSVRLGVGNGTFGASTSFAVGSTPYYIAVADFNGDGKQDFVTANQSSSVSVCLGTGTGSFGAATNYSLPSESFSLAIGDFNNDGIQDIAAANGYGPGWVSVLLGTGSGTFGAASNFAAGGDATYISLADFNSDGNVDVATSSRGGNVVNVNLGTGTGSLGAPTAYPVGGNPFGIATGDFNGDGNQDFVVTNFEGGQNSVSVCLGDGAGNFSAANNYPAGGQCYGVSVGDFNGDGKQDLAVSNYSTQNISILIGSGTGSFSAPVNYALGAPGRAIAVGDYNGDGRQDIAVTTDANTFPHFVYMLFGIANEINVRGGLPLTDIADGDATPTVTDHTNFGSTNTATSITRTFTIQNTGTTPLSITGTSVTGTNASEFVVTTAPASSVAASGSTTVEVTFTPTTGGTRTATLHIASNDCDEAVYDFALLGTGLCTTLTMANNLDVVTTTIVPGSNLFYADDCRAVMSITPNGANPVSGNITTKVWVQATQPSYNGRPYLMRHYEITPATNAATATARITLYATQAEFDAFNLFAFNGDDMPTGPGDNAGIANIRFYKYSGSSSDGSGTPSTYSQPGIMIDPENADIVWNNTLSRWEISFDVTGFSGFFGGNSGNTILPLQLLSFDGSKQANSTVLNWKTANEQNTKYFEIESSTNGRSFAKMATINAAGIGSQSYSYTDVNAYTSKVWYRLKMIDADGKFSYSSMVLMNHSARQPVTLSPNPATSWININISNATLLNTAVQLTDAKGVLVKVVKLSGYNQQVNIESLAKGIYMLRFVDGTVHRFVKE